MVLSQYTEANNHGLDIWKNAFHFISMFHLFSLRHFKYSTSGSNDTEFIFFLFFVFLVLGVASIFIYLVRKAKLMPNNNEKRKMASVEGMS